MATPALSVSSPQADGQATAARPGAERGILITVALSTTLAPLNSTMIATALPEIMRSFRADLGTAGWLITSYLVTMAALQPVAGKLGDRLGRRPLLLGGLVYFALASLGAALAPNLPVLLLCRFQQAVAGAIALPNGSALIREVLPAERRAGGYGMVGAIVSLAAAAGPPLGGLLVSTAGWQAIFWVNVPVVLAALLAGWRTLPSVPPRAKTSSFDGLGAVLMFAIVAGLALLLRQSGAGLSSTWLVGAAVLIGALVVFGWQEVRHPDPVFRPRFFRHPAFASASAAVALSNLAMYTTLLALPIILAQDEVWPAARIGLVLTALSATNVVAGPLGGRLADRYGRRWPAVAGLTLLTLGLIPLAVESGILPVPELVGALGVAGIGLGLSSAGMQTAAVEAVSPRDAGAASGIYSTCRYLGSIAGASLLPGLLSGTSGSPMPAGVHAVFVLVVLAAALAAASSLGLRTSTPS